MSSGPGATAPRPSWRRPVLIGCLVLLVPALLVLGLVAFKWPALRRGYHAMAGTLRQLEAVRTTVEGRYGGTVQVVAKHQAGVPGTLLSLTLVNPPLLDRADAEEGPSRGQALEVATVAREALASPVDYARYEVVFARRRGVGVTIDKNWGFRFAASELPPPTAPSR